MDYQIKEDDSTERANSFDRFAREASIIGLITGILARESAFMVMQRMGYGGAIEDGHQRARDSAIRELIYRMRQAGMDVPDWSYDQVTAVQAFEKGPEDSEGE